jgi:putative inorganic carbon (hco3(-)) transporter
MKTLMRTRRLESGVDSLREYGTRNAAFYLFCAFIISYFGRFGRRIPLLGMLHFDLALAGMTLVAIVFSRRALNLRAATQHQLDPVAKRLWILLGYIVVTIPFVQWPGSVLHNLEAYLKSLSFFFFVVATVDTTRKLRILLVVYTTTQVWRVIEPLYMHLTSGYWGAQASIGNWELIDRLSGSPYDTINPNGLAFVIIMTLPMLQFLVNPSSAIRRIVWAAIAAAMCYALVLSASRSGFLAFVFLCLFVIWRMRNRAGWLVVALVGATVAIALMTNMQRERYVSIFSHSAPGGATAEGRITGVIEDFKVSLRRPVFGHGLGTSTEANAHFHGDDKPSHNLYTETAEELGYVGLALVLWLIWSFLRACWTAQEVVNASATTDTRLEFLHGVAASLVAVVAVDLFFSFASFGLSEPYWYFIGGLSVATTRLAAKLSPVTTQLPAGRRDRVGSYRRQGERAAPRLNAG